MHVQIRGIRNSTLPDIRARALGYSTAPVLMRLLFSNSTLLFLVSELLAYTMFIGSQHSHLLVAKLCYLVRSMCIVLEKCCYAALDKKLNVNILI